MYSGSKSLLFCWLPVDKAESFSFTRLSQLHTTILLVCTAFAILLEERNRTEKRSKYKSTCGVQTILPHNDIVIAGSCPDFTHQGASLRQERQLDTSAWNVSIAAVVNVSCMHASLAEKLMGLVQSGVYNNVSIVKKKKYQILW